MRITSKGWFFLIPLLLICTSPAIGGQEEEPLAVGDGIVVTKDDVQQLRRYMEERKFTSTDEQFLKVAIRMALFSAEAKKLSLYSESDVSGEALEPVQKKVWLSDLYVQKLLKEYPLSDLVIESYYYAHPDYFDLKKGETKPISDLHRRKIKAVVVTAKSSEIASAAFESLKEKYNIRILKEGQ